MDVKSLLGVATPLTRQLEDEMLSAVRLEGIPNLHDEMSIFDSARIIADQIRIPDKLLDFLHAKSRWNPMPKAEWSLAVRSACAIDLMLRRVFKQRLGKFGNLIDNREALEKLPTGTLLVSFHGAFIRLARPLFAAAIPDGLQVHKRFAEEDSRGALFSSLRTLQDGKSLLMAADGTQGNMAGVPTIRVFETETPVGSGTAFLAHTLGCETFWYALTRREMRFAVIIEKAPRREPSESLTSFSERFWQFYASKIEENFTGDPHNISLLPRWRRPFANYLSRQTSNG
jgi:hypothetical protein